MNEFQKLLMYLNIQMHNFGVLHRHLSGDAGWFENHEELEEWRDCAAKQLDELCEEAQALGFPEPGLKDALLAFGGEEITPEPRDLRETLSLAQGMMRGIAGMLRAAEQGVPPSVQGRLQEMEYKWEKLAGYKLARVLGEAQKGPGHDRRQAPAPRQAPPPPAEYDDD